MKRGPFSLQSHFTVGQKGLLLVSIPLAFELMFVGTLAGLLQQAESEVKRESHARAVSAAVNRLINDIYDLRKYIQRRVLARDSQESMAQMRILRSDIDRIDALVSENPQQAEIMRRARVGVEEGVELVKKIADVAETGGLASAARVVQEYRDEFKRLREAAEVDLQSLIEEQERITQHSPQIQASFRRQVEVLLAAGLGVNIVLAVCLAHYFSTGTTRRLQVLMDNTRRLGAGNPLNPPLGGNDEIAHLDRVFNEMAAELAEARRKEQEIIRMKQEFLAMISHDLKTPLCSIQVIHDNLQKGAYGELSESARESVMVAERSVDRLIRLVNDLLQTARVEAGKLDLNLADTSISSIVESSVMSVLGFADKSGVEFEVEINDAPVRADHDRVVQVLVNFLSNAVKFAPRGSTVTIATADHGASVRVSVIDRGSGVPAALRESIFDPFRQVRRSDATDKGGTGLGLAICKAIIEEHGGQVGVDSEDGKGSTFWFTLPKAG